MPKQVDFIKQKKSTLFKFFDIRTHNGFIDVYHPKKNKEINFRVWTIPYHVTKDETKRTLALKISKGDKFNVKNWKEFAFISEGKVHIWNEFKDDNYKELARMVSKRQGSLDYFFEGHCRICNKELMEDMSLCTGVCSNCYERGI